MGFFGMGRKKTLEKAMAAGAVMTALAAAYVAQSERFVKLVEQEDKELAARLIKDPEKTREWRKASEALHEVERLMYNSDLILPKIESAVTFERDIFFITAWFHTVPKSRKFKSLCADFIKPLKDIGLDATAKKQEENLLKYFEGIEGFIVQKMDKSVAELLKKPKEEITEYLKTHDIIKKLQILLKAAKAAGFKKTAKTVMHAMVNIRGAVA